MKLYKVKSVKYAGDDWWEIRIDGPKETSIPMRQKRPGACDAEMLKRAEQWCEKRNKDLGLIQRTCGDVERYRRIQQARLTVSVKS